MAKGLRSNKKKALRTIRRTDVKTSDKYLEAETKRLASQQLTAEAGKAARELAEQNRAANPAEAIPEGAGKMDIDSEPPKKSFGVPVSKKKKLKIQKRKKRADGINSFHKKKGKGKGKRK
jgi:hypothetical protein